MLGFWKRRAAKRRETQRKISEYGARLLRAEKRIARLERTLAAEEHLRGQEESEHLTTAQLVDEWVNGKVRAE